MEKYITNRAARPTHRPAQSEESRTYAMAEAIRNLTDEGHTTLTTDQIIECGFTPDEISRLMPLAKGIATTLPTRNSTPAMVTKSPSLNSGAGASRPRFFRDW